MPQRKIDITELQKHGLFLASPQYGGQCHTIFAKSITDLGLACGYYRLPLYTHWVMNESAVHRARNYCADEFLRSASDHLLFVDSDIGFKAEDAIELLILQIQNPEYGIIGGPYKMKTLAKNAWAFNYDKDFDPDATEPQEVSGTGTGFMLIHRWVFEKFTKSYPELMYRPDSYPGTPFDGSRDIMKFFRYEIDPETRRDLTEDYWFCNRARDIGIKTWLCSWMKLRHAGMHIFE
jgi:hypothetical protein